MEVLTERVAFFGENGCRVSDHALTLPVYREADGATLDRIFAAGLAGKSVSAEDQAAFATAVLRELGKSTPGGDGCFSCTSVRCATTTPGCFGRSGPTPGFDSMADGETARPLAQLLDSMDVTGELPKTILYGLNPRDNELIATMIGNFQDGSVPGKIQFGSGWWFNDQKDGMERQMIALANMGLLRRFVGMLTDSRSFLSFPRHEYFRRTLCNLVGTWVEDGEAPNDINLLGSMVGEICWDNAVEYFGIDLGGTT
jgi:glucuronate isomerase